MDGLSTAASGFAVVSLADQLADRIKQLYEFWSAVNAAPANILTTATELNQLLGVLAEISKFGQQYGAKPTTVEVLEKCTQHVKALVDIVVELQTGFASSKRHVRKWSAIKAVFKEDKIRTFRDEVERVKTTLLLILQVNQRPQMQFQNEQGSAELLVEGMRSLHVEQSSAIPAVSKDEERSCIQSLYMADYATKLGEIPDREPGTCEWVANHGKFKEWLAIEESALMWLSGNPGCGKTVISSFLIKYLKEMYGGIVIYFICDNKDEHFRSKQSLLRSLLHQLFVANPRLVRHAVPDFKNMKDSMAVSTATLWKIFEKVMQDGDVGTVYCVLDALDECEDDARKWILAKLGRFFSRCTEEAPMSGGSLRMIVTSRPWEDIEVGLDTTSRIHLKTEDEGSINQDVKKFVEKRVEILAKRRKYSAHQKDMVTKTLINGANGMFLWVTLIIDDLERNPSRNLEQRLQGLPETLYDVYNQIMDRIDPAAMQRVMHILTWVVTAVRPLTPEELAMACEIQDLNQLSDANSGELLDALIGDLGLCGPILTIRHGYVNLIHQSAKDFFLLDQSQPELPRSLAKHYINLAISNAQLTDLCIKYLSFDDLGTRSVIFDGTPGSRDKFAALLEIFPFLAYAAHYWPDHFQGSGEFIESSLESAYQLFKRTDNLRVWYQVYAYMSFKRYNPFVYLRGNYPIHVAVLLGIPSIVAQVLVGEVDIDERDDNGEAPLHVSIHCGNSIITQQLLAAGAGVNTCSNGGKSPLHYAIRWCKIDIARILIQAGADVNVRTHEKQTPLHLVSKDEGSILTELLLKNGGDVNAIDIRGQTPLQMALKQRCKNSIIKQLLEAGANVTNCLHLAMDHEYFSDTLFNMIMAKEPNLEEANLYGETTLHRAAASGQEWILRLLVEKGADIQAKNGAGKTAIQLAAQNGYEEIVGFLMGQESILEDHVDYLRVARLYNAAKGGNADAVQLLLQRKPYDVNMTDSDGRTMLYWASQEGYEGIVELLLEGGAEINLADSSGWTALDRAAELGQIKVVQMLLEKNAIRGTLDYPSLIRALHQAAKEGHDQIIQLLLESGAPVNALTPDSKLPLCTASSMGLESTVKLLLENGADPRLLAREGPEYSTALSRAVYSGHKRATQILLDHGGNANDQNRRGQAILHQAALYGCRPIVELLLEKGASVNHQDEGGQTALHKAAYSGKVVIVKLLLQKGAHVNDRDESGSTALHIASARGYFATVQLLLESGADTQIKDHLGRTALRRAILKNHKAVIKLLSSQATV